MAVRIVMLTAVVLVIVSVQALAQESGAKMVFGQGVGTSCGAWTRARQAKSVSVGLSAQWIAGYLSGVNAESNSTDFLRGTDFDGLMAWVDNYCRSNPLELVGTAAFQLVEELRSRAQR